mmetsp:Transcript_7059/g.10118  ORF Transcript_7059/g.10118 Transcript_7059/m.10118 type:complete len:253 (-) Transcript_7059:405-1163(-)
MMETIESNSPAEEATFEFQAGVTAVLRSWSAFRTAVENEWGGTNSLSKAENLRTHIFTCFEYTNNQNNPASTVVTMQRPKMELEALEDNLFLYLEEEYTIVLEDESEKQVARVIFQMFEMCGRGDFSLSRRIVSQEQEKSANANGMPKSTIKVEGEIDDDDSDEEMEDIKPSQEETMENPPPTNLMSGMESTPWRAKLYASEYLFGIPPEVRLAMKANEATVRQLGEAVQEKSAPMVDDDGFMVVTKKKGNR